MSRRWMFVLLAMVMTLGLSFPEIGQPAQTPAKKVNIAVAQEPASLDVSQETGGDTVTVMGNVNETLIDRSTNGKLIPGLASSWKVSPDGKVLEFTLRKGVKFHSGDPLTVKDVIFSFERAQAKNRVMPSRLKPIEKIEVLDESRIRMLFNTPDVTFIPKLAAGVMIVSKAYYDRVGEDVFTRKPVGTGPYKFVRYEDGQYIDIERFEDYWDKKPTVLEARFYFTPEDTTRIAKLQAGEVDLIQGVPFNLVKMIESSPNFKTVKFGSNNPSMGLVFSLRDPKKPWYDKRVRLAMASAIDCDSIIKNILYGIPNHWPWLAPGELGYDPTLKTYPYDPKRAKELLAEAGFPKGFDFNLYWVTKGGRTPMASEVVQAIASYFEAVGIRTKLEGLEIETYRSTRKAATDFVGYYSGGLPGAPDPTQTADAYFTCKGANSVYCNKEFDKILSEAKATLNDDKREDLIKKMVKILREEVATIPIFDNVATYGMKKNIDFVPTQAISMDLVRVQDITIK